MTTFNLIIQGDDVSTPALKALHRLSSASRIERVGNQAFRLSGIRLSSRPEVAEYCERAHLDFAFVEGGSKLTDFGLIAMDMDSTLITIECVDEIADFAGLKAEVAAVTESAMRGEIDWPESLRRRVALLEGLDESALQRVYAERLQLSAGAAKLIDAARQHGIKLLLVSGGFTFFTDRLKPRLGFDYAFSNTLEIEGGKLTGRVSGLLLDANAKAHHVARLRDMLNLTRDQVIVIGDGANDLKMMAETNFSVAYRAKPIVRQQASYALNYVGLDGLLNVFPV
jgi:phosphoserine phosphatase